MNLDLNSILISIFFGMIGFGAWRYGRRITSARHMLLAVALMLFPYFVSNIWMMLSIGCALTLFLFWPPL